MRAKLIQLESVMAEKLTASDLDQFHSFRRDLLGF